MLRQFPISFALLRLLTESSRPPCIRQIPQQPKFRRPPIVNESPVAMGIWNAFSEIVEAVTPWSVAEAEAPAEEPKVCMAT